MPSRSTFTRAAGAFALVLTLLGPSRARAQQAAPQPPIPPTGEPPPPHMRAQEEAAITYQTQQNYRQAHQEEWRRQAAAEVERERNAAWQQRGRDLIPPPYTTRMPRPNLNVVGVLGHSGGGWLMGLSGILNVRINRWWGMSTAGSYLTMGNPTLRAATSEVTVFGTPGRSKSLYIDAEHVVFRLGHQLAFPIDAPDIKRVYLAPLVGLGGSFAVGQLTRKTYVAFVYETRFAYRFGLGPGRDSMLGGWLLDFNLGFGLGFQ
jgi:hypothetical protein